MGSEKLFKERVKIYQNFLDLLIIRGHIDKDLLKGRVLDWGAGSGVGTVALQQFGGDIEAVDIRKAAVDQIIENGILSKNKVHQTDGIQFLKDHPDTYDIIAALLFGPISRQKDIEFLKAFIEAAKIALKPEGRIIIHSDLGSFQKIIRFEKQYHLGKIIEIPGFLPAYLISKPGKSPFTQYDGELIIKNLKSWIRRNK